MPAEKPSYKIWPALGLHDFGTFLAVPHFFIDKLIPVGGGIPHAFWKFLFVVWRDVIAPAQKNEDGTYKHNYRCKKTVKQWSDIFHVPRLAAMDATIACSCSGLFTVEFGWRDMKDKPGVPTTLHYRQQSTEQDWIAFITGLANAHKWCKTAKMSRHGMHTVEGDQPDGAILSYEEERTASWSWELVVAIEVDSARQEMNLRPANVKRIEWLLGKGIGKREIDGSITVYGRRSAGEIQKLRAKRKFGPDGGSPEVGRGDLFVKDPV